MSKYAPLQRFLSEGDDEITLTLAQIEQIVPDIAESFAKDARWWNNDDPSHSQCRAWGDAGYSAHPYLRSGTVTFRRKVL